MSFEISKRLERLSSLSIKKPQIIIELPSLGLSFGSISSRDFWRIGDVHSIGEAGLLIGGMVENQNRKALIHKSSKPVFTQQLLQDRGGSSSTTRAKFKLVDKNKELTRAFSPGQIVEEPLYTEARIYQTFEGGVHPEDSINTLNGIITDIDFGSGFVDIQITSSEDLKKREIYRKWTSEITEDINSTTKIIHLRSIDGLFESVDILDQYIIIDSEIIKVISTEGSTITNCIRGQLGSAASSHTEDSRARSLFRFQENAIDLALKIMISGVGVYASGVEVTSFVRTSDGDVFNAVYFGGVNVKDEYGLVVGSLVNCHGSQNQENEFTEREIIQIVSNSSGSYFVLSGEPLIFEEFAVATVSFKSQYDTLPEGCSMSPTQIDIEEHQKVKEFFSTSLPTYDFRETKSINAKEFIDEQVYYPSGFSAIPRKGRASIKAQIPPLAFDGIKTFNEKNVLNPDKLSIKRSVNKFFYNEIVYEYGYDPVSENTKDTNSLDSTASQSRFAGKGKSPLIISARGLNRSHDTFILLQQRRFLTRYQFGAESINIKTLYGEGFNSEIGDACIFGSPALQISDSSSGDRKFKPRIMEIQNIKNSPNTGEISISLLDTSLTLDGRNAVISPTSAIDITKTTTGRVFIERSFSTKSFEEESHKWIRYIGEKITIRNDVFTFLEEVTLVGFDQNDSNIMIISPNLSRVPLEGLIVEAPRYSGPADEKSLWKAINAFICPEVLVVGSTDSSKIEISIVDVDKFFVGGSIRVSSRDYSMDTGRERVEVVEIIGNILTVTDMGFTPGPGYLINLIGFSSDRGKPYRYI